MAAPKKVIVEAPKKRIQGVTKPKPTQKNLAKIVTRRDKEGKEYQVLSMPDYAPGTPVSISVKNPLRPNGVEYVAAWILKQIPTKDTEMAMYQVSFWRKSKRQPAVMALSALHAGCLAGRRASPIGI